MVKQPIIKSSLTKHWQSPQRYAKKENLCFFAVLPTVALGEYVSVFGFVLFYQYNSSWPFCFWMHWVHVRMNSLYCCRHSLTTNVPHACCHSCPELEWFLCVHFLKSNFNQINTKMGMSKNMIVVREDLHTWGWYSFTLTGNCVLY